MPDSKLIPIKCNLDLGPEYIDEHTARFMKGLTPFTGAVGDAGSNVLEGENEIKLKPNQSNELYVNIPLPAGDNFMVGGRGFPENNKIYVAVWNSNNDHFWYRLNCSTRTFDIIKIDPCFNFQKKPEHFMGIGQITLTLVPLVNPDTNVEFVAEELKWTDNFNYQGYLRVQDCIDTNGFDATLFPYFAGTYDKCPIVRMGVPTPKECIAVKEIPTVPGFKSDIEITFVGGATVDEVATAVTFAGIPGSYLVTFYAATNSMKFQTATNGSEFTVTPNIITINGTVTNNGLRNILGIGISSSLVNDQKNNRLLYQKWFFMQQDVDVWGRPSEWGVRSTEYVPGINDCISNSNNIVRCLELGLNVRNPFIDSINIAFISCVNGTSTIWKKEATLFLYKGSNIGEWWKRPRNPDIDFDQTTNTVKYKFCRDKECDIVPPDETTRNENPMPTRSAAIMDLNHETALFNNKSKFPPFSQELREKITHKVIPPSESELGLRTITIYGAIWSEFNKRYVAVVPDYNNGFYFGGITSAGQYNGAWAERYQQRFKNKAQSGFEGYLVGGGSVVSTQVVQQNDGSLLEDPKHTFGVGGNGTGDNKLVLQKWVFTNVPIPPSGKYIFRLASHLSDSNVDANYRETSTTVWGLCPYTRNPFNLLQIAEQSRALSQEVVIDVCDKDYDTFKDDNKILVMCDLAGSANGQENKALCRYVYETNKNGYNQSPVELALISAVNMVNSTITDHNGFMWASTRGRGRSYSITHLDKCVGVGMVFGQSNSAGMVIQPPVFTQGVLNKPCNRVLIRGKILLQGTNIGISNALVTITRGSSAVTDENGEFEILAHDSVWDVWQGKVRKDQLIITSACAYDKVCLDIQVPWAACTNCNERVVNISTDIILGYTNKNGLLSGGVYPYGCCGFDWLGRLTFVQPLGLINIPTIIETKAIAPSDVQINIDPAATFPANIEYITFWIGPETTLAKYLTWIADKVEFIDAQGLVNDISPTQIRIYYGSILEFAKLNNFNVTTAWDFIPEGATRPVLNDRVRFWINGDGKYFTKAISSLIKYDDTGKAFTIDYSSDLKNLKENALIRLERIKNCTGNEAYREICGSKVEIRNRKAQRNQFILNAFDTYYLNRAMPVPAPVPQPTVAAITTTVTTGNTAVATQQIPVPTPTVLQLRTFGFKFEHFAPSNYWGNGCLIGRHHVKNPYEAELIEPYQVMRSGALSVNGQLNYLCYFDDRKKLNFEIPECGGITSVLQKIGIIAAICRTKIFGVGFNDNLGRVNTDGTFQAGSIVNEFGKPQPIDDYGCHPKDKMSIQFKNGLVMWVDRNRAEAVQSDFAKVMSFTKDKCNGWMKAKVKQVLADDLAYFTGTITPANEYLITNQTLAGEMGYINSEREANPLISETVTFHIGTRDLIQWLGFTYENYAWLDGDILNNQMFSFMKGIPYSHYNGKQNNSFNVFHGVETEKVLDVIFRGSDAFKKKMFLIVMNWCENQLFFADKVTTEAKQLSRSLLEHWYKGAYMSSGVLLCDLNTIPDPNMPIETGANALMDGDRLYGEWLRLRLIGDPAFNSKYCELLGIEVLASPFEKS